MELWVAAHSSISDKKEILKKFKIEINKGRAASYNARGAKGIVSRKLRVSVFYLPGTKIRMHRDFGTNQ